MTHTTTADWASLKGVAELFKALTAKGASHPRIAEYVTQHIAITENIHVTAEQISAALIAHSHKKLFGEAQPFASPPQIKEPLRWIYRDEVLACIYALYLQRTDAQLVDIINKRYRTEDDMVISKHHISNLRTHYGWSKQGLARINTDFNIRRISRDADSRRDNEARKASAQARDNNLAPPKGGGPFALANLPRGGCKRIIGDPSNVKVWCGDPQKPNSSYCAAHAPPCG